MGCITKRKNITENSTDIKENNVLLVKHFDEKFPITEEQLQAIKCFHCQDNKKCKEKLAFNLDKLKQWHTSTYDNPYTTPIRHLLNIMYLPKNHPLIVLTNITRHIIDKAHTNSSKIHP